MNIESTHREISFSDKNKTFEVFFPKECDLDKINRVIIRGRELIEVVHGEWIHGREIGKEWNCGYWITYFEDWHCSNCGVVFEQESKPKYHFCPNCGAKMDGEEKKDEID